MTTDPAAGAALVDSLSSAADAWSAVLTDPVTVIIEVEIASLGPGALASGAPETEPFAYTDVATALIADEKTAVDDDAVASLQPGPFLEAITNDTSAPGAPVIRIGAAAPGVWNSTLLVPTANAKALGLPTGSPIDGVLTINDAFLPAFDYDSSDGSEPGTFDFKTIAMHELGHMMGFISGVDQVDFSGGAGPDAPDDISGDAVFKPFDLFRYHPDSLAAPDQPASGTVLDWRTGPPTGTIAPIFPVFSFDEGTSIVAPLEGGFFNGDGEQASHWKDTGAPFGLFVPDLDMETVIDLSVADLTVFDAIGWDPVPEPSTALLALLAMGGLLGRPFRHR